MNSSALTNAQTALTQGGNAGVVNEAAQPLLAMSGICKSFPGVRALHHAGLRLFAGEVHVLMGQNGAGKSTLIKVLTGVEAADSGQMLLDGRTIAPASVLDAQDEGISTVYQEVNLCPNLSVAENIFIGRYPMRGRRIDWATVESRARDVLTSLDIRIDVTDLLSSYPVAIQQMVAIARAISADARVLILDEPTSSLDQHEVEQLFNAMRRLKARGMAILFVTHFLEQTYAVGDRITVLRNGELEGEYLASELPRLTLINKMVGRVVEEVACIPKKLLAAGEGPQAFLAARGVGRAGTLSPIDMEVHRGRVLGLAGLLGSGRTEIARLLFGIDKADAGVVEIDGKPVALRTPRDAIRHGIALCSEDRKTEGIIAELSIRENIILSLQAKRGMFRYIPYKQQKKLADDFIARLGINTPHAEKAIGLLSGGNQQKALLARWLATEPSMLILDEPTRGIDIAAKQEIMDLVSKQCDKGLAIVFISSEMAEVLRMSDHIVVLRDREKIGELTCEEADEDGVYNMIAGGHA
jgi:galactofuranose transport system ATP-binding protein